MKQISKVREISKKYHLGNILLASITLVLSVALFDKSYFPSHASGVPSGQKVWTWGDNTYGQLGTASSSTSSASPVQVTSLSSGVAYVATAYNTDYAVKTD